MKKEDCSSIGYVAKLHGYKGGLSVVIEKAYCDFFDKVEMFYLLIDEQLIPFFLSHQSRKSKELRYVKLDGLDNEHAARALLKSEIYIATVDLPELEIQENSHQHLIGFKITQINGSSIGRIAEIIDHDINPLMVVNFQNREVLIPIQEALIVNIDQVKKEIQMDLPDGLLEL